MTDTSHKSTAIADPPQVMTVDQVCRYLQLSRAKVYRLAGDGELPAVKIGDQWRFFRPEIDRWLIDRSRANVGESTAAADLDLTRPQVSTNGAM